jgi:hypothetical protein
MVQSKKATGMAMMAMGLRESEGWTILWIGNVRIGNRFSSCAVEAT